MENTMETEMFEAMYGMDEHEERKEGFVVNDDNKADWVLRKIKQNADKMEEIQELYEAQSMRLTAWKSEQLDRLTKDKENLEMLLAPYVESKLNGGKKNLSYFPTASAVSVPFRQKSRRTKTCSLSSLKRFPQEISRSRNPSTGQALRRALRLTVTR